MSNSGGLSPEEYNVMESLMKAWDSFAALPKQNNDDYTAFKDAIHRCQHLLMIRQVRKNHSDFYNIR